VHLSGILLPIGVVRGGGLSPPALIIASQKLVNVCPRMG